MFTRPLGGDSRFILWLLALDVMEAAGVGVVALARRFTRKDRWRRHLLALKAGGLISAPGEGPLDERVVRLTDAGNAALWGGVDPEARWRRGWDGVWRMAMFDVPESRGALRTRMRRKLRSLRFGWLQNSVWLSPDPVGELLRTLRGGKVAVESLLFMEGRPAGGENDAELVAGAWDFGMLARLHADYLKLLQERPHPGRTLRRGTWSAWLAIEDRAWRAIARVDPFLPAVLCPRAYAGRTVWEARREMLREGADAMIETVRAD
jgi:phenylacetic acid degradation operon negative regulatory protein